VGKPNVKTGKKKSPAKKINAVATDVSDAVAAAVSDIESVMAPELAPLELLPIDLIKSSPVNPRNFEGREKEIREPKAWAGLKKDGTPKGCIYG